MMNNKNKIAEVAFLLSLREGFDNISIKQIQEESGLSPGTIYYHFKNKSEILFYMINRYLLEGFFFDFKEAMRNFNGSFIEKIEFIFNYKIYDFVKVEENSSQEGYELDSGKYFSLFAAIYHQNPEIRPIFTELQDGLYDFFAELLREAIKNGEIREDIDVKLLTIFIKTCLQGYIFEWLYQPKLSLEEIVDANVKMIWEAVKKE